MLKFNRKAKGSTAKRVMEVLPRHEDDSGHENTEDRILPMTHPYSVPGVTNTTTVPMGDEGNTPKIASSSLRTHSNGRNKNALPPLFIYIEAGDFRRAMERTKRHPREVRTWASIKIKKSSESTKRLPLHQACFKLRAASTSIVKCNGPNTVEEDPFVEICRFILFLLKMYPDACKERETRHGCLPLHLVAFASCTQSSVSSKVNSDAIVDESKDATPSLLLPSNSATSTFSLLSEVPSYETDPENEKSSTVISKPATISHNIRSISETNTRTTMSAAIYGEKFTGIETDLQKEGNGGQSERERSHVSSLAQSLRSSRAATAVAEQQSEQTQCVSIGNNIFVSEKREEWVVKVLNALLDAHPRAIRSGSEGGRLPLHFAAAGRATPRVISTLITAYPEATKHRTKDGSLPVHLCAHWGISHSNVVAIMLKSYPDSTYGRNRWERTPLEEALCMAGENGRPHQAALVRALRKHHSFWTRPEGFYFRQANLSSREAKHHIVDIDETVDSMEDSIDGDDIGIEANYLSLNPRGRAYGGLHTSNKDKEGLSATGNDLPTLIRTLNWDLAAQRLKMIPSDARLNLKIATRGGFTASEGFTPLHFACERRPPKEFLVTLVNLFPEAVGKKTIPGGKLPLHIACTWHAPKESIDILLAADRTTSKVPDDLGNLPIHSACFSGASSTVVEKLLKSYPKAVLSRNNHGSLPEDIVKRLKHDSRVSALALLHLCKHEVNTKRRMKHHRNRSEGMILNHRSSEFDSTNYEIENFDNGEIEVTYSGGNDTKKELVWI